MGLKEQKLSCCPLTSGRMLVFVWGCFWPITGNINATILLTCCWSVVRAPGSKLILVSLSHLPTSSIDANVNCESVAVLVVISYVNNHASVGKRAELSAENMPAPHHEVRWVNQNLERKVDS